MRPTLLLAALLPLVVLAPSASADPAPLPANADEGMWPFNMVPRASLEKLHGVALSDAWLDHLRLASVRFGSGGSGSFVSKNGLVLTNHHVAFDCISKLASPGHDYVATGYLAGRDGSEVKCPDLELDQLIATADVTDAVKAAKHPGMSDADANAAMKGAMAGLEKDCTQQGGDGVHCDVVTLYAGGKYHLYTYKKFKDVRLVFAPEQSVAFFGGDPDNFTYPRFDFDLAIFRVYEGNKPYAPKDFLEWNPNGPREGDPVFVSGNPAKTDRMDTMAQLTRLRDVVYPYYLDAAKGERAALLGFAGDDSERKREGAHVVFRLENGIKAITGEESGLRDPVLMKKKQDDEKALRKLVANDAGLAAQYGHAWDDAAQAQATLATTYKRYMALERAAYRSDLWDIARDLVRLPKELATPNATRLKEYRDSNLDSLKLALFSPAPLYGGVEVALIKSWLDRMVRDLGPSDAVVKRVVGGRRTLDVAEELVAGTKLTDLYARHALYDGGQAAVDASTDPLVMLVRDIDQEARAVRKQYEDGVEAPMRKVGQEVAQAVFAARGTSVYPDATYTLRLSPGVVRGYTAHGKKVPWSTDFAGMFKHATGKDPLALPQRWLDKKGALKPDAPLDFVSTNDIIGGNSGSPVVDKDGKLVGLIFDGNIQSLPNAFVYSDAIARAVSVDTAGMLEALKSVFGADALVAELLGSGAAAAGMH